jgi:uncharacterized delta-60 repeat protein
VRFLPGGPVDTRYGGGDGVVPVPERGDGLALQPDGKILVTRGGRVARLNPDGALDTSFGNGGHVVFDYPIGRRPQEWAEGEPYGGFIPTDVAWQASSGKIVLGGHTPDFGDFAAVRLNLDGSVDTTFADGLGMVTTDSDYADYGGRIDLGSDGTIYMAGSETDDREAAMVRFDKDGRAALNREVPVVYAAYDVAVGPDGEILMIGHSPNYDREADKEHEDIQVARLNPDLSVDPTFGGREGVRTDVFGGSYDYANAVVVTPDGDVVVAGGANNSPVLVGYDGGGPRRVQYAYVDGSAWADSFRRHVGPWGYRVLTEAPSYLYEPGAPLPWLNLNQVAVGFNRPVDVERGDLRLRGVSVAEYAVADFSYDPDTRTAVWTLDRTIGADRVRVELDVEGVRPFATQFNVLPGDVDRGGTVVAAGAVKRSFFRTVSNPGVWPDPYSIFRDVDGSGAILADDFSEVKKRFFTRLPAGEPTPVPAAITAQAAAPLRSRSVARSLFGAAPVLE